MNVIKQEKIVVAKRERVAFYCRVSSSSEAQENSFESQVQYYQRYQAMNPQYDYVGIYADEGLSGRLHQEKRDGFYSLLKDAKAGLIDRIIVKSFSRFSRNTVVGMKALKELQLLGVTIWFENNGIDTKLTSSEMMLTTLNFIAESESIKISESCIWGFRERFANGRYQHSVAPYGYSLINNGDLVINEEQAYVLKKMYQMVLDGFSITSMAKYFNEQRVPSAKGGKWTVSCITTILRNERNIGDMLLQKHFSENNGENHKKKNKNILQQYYVMGTHEPIIERSVYDEVKEILDARQRKFNRNTEANQVYPLSSKIKCSQCGATVRRRVNHKGKPYESIKWGCSTNIKSASECDVKQIKQEEVYEHVLYLINELRENNYIVLNDYMNELVDKSELLKNKDYQKLKIELNKIKKQKTIVEIESSTLYSAFLLEKLQRLKHSEQRLIHEMDKFENKVNQHYQEFTREIVEYLKRNPIENVLDIERFIEQYIKMIHVSNEEITFKLRGEFKKGYVR